MAKVTITSESLIEAVSAWTNTARPPSCSQMAAALKDLDVLSQLPTGVEQFIKNCSPELNEIKSLQKFPLARVNRNRFH